LVRRVEARVLVDAFGEGRDGFERFAVPRGFLVGVRDTA
jgi:hypothetical protein